MEGARLKVAEVRVVSILFLRGEIDFDHERFLILFDDSVSSQPFAMSFYHLFARFQNERFFLSIVPSLDYNLSEERIYPPPQRPALGPIRLKMPTPPPVPPVVSCRGCPEDDSIC